MQNPSGGSQAQHYSRARFRARGSVKNHGGRKHNYGSRNNNPRWSPMGPRPHLGLPANRGRFPPLDLEDQAWCGAVNKAPVRTFPRVPWHVPHADSGHTTPRAEPRHAVLKTEMSSIATPLMDKSVDMPNAHNFSNQGVTPSAPRAMFQRPFHQKPAQNASPRPTLPNIATPMAEFPYRAPTPRTEFPNRPPHDKIKFGPSIPPISLDASLPTFDLQAQSVVQQCLLSPDGRRAVDLVLSDVHQLLRPILPDNNPIVYGSMATGLALETSDIDCFVDSQRIPDGRERIKILIQNYKIFYRRATFKDVLRIPNARVPLVKAVHSRTGIEIDISCTSEAALNNTELVKFLVQTDVRIRPLIVLISICYRLNGLAGTHRFVSYTIVLLTIFYLQNLEVSILPPLKKILHYVHDEPWPVNFTADVQKHLQAPNRSNLTELFSGFFKFYNSFDFDNNVVSTFMGQALPVACFSVPDKLPDELSKLKEYYNADPSCRNNFLDRFICVQDPMEHYINTTSYIQLKTLAHFKRANSYMVEMMGNNPETSWLENMMKMPEEIAVLNPPTLKSKPDPDVQFNINYPRDESLSEEEWMLRLEKDLRAVFTLLLFDVVEVIKEPEAKVRISEGPVHNRTLLAFHLQTYFNVFTKRFKGLPATVLENPAIFQSVAKKISCISVQMKRPTSSFHCELALKQPVSPGELPVLVKDINENASNTYLHLSGMLRDNLTKLLGAARKFDAQGEAPKELNQPDLVMRKSQQAGVRFVVSYKREESEEEDAWRERFKVDLIAMFEFLMLEHEDITLSRENTEILVDGESILFAFKLSTPYNIFTKRFKNSYNQIIKNPSSVPSVVSENTLLCSDVNLLTAGTFHGELLLIQSDCLPPDRVFAKMYDINQNLRNNFNHYSANLQMNFGCLLDSIKKFRLMQSESGENTQSSPPK